MGTSSIYNGPKNNNSLLPSDYTDEQGNQENDIINGQNVAWQTVKANFSKYINSKSGKSSRNSSSIEHITRQYVKASGGTKTLILKSPSGLFSGKNLYSFYDSVRSNGIKKTLEMLHIQFKGKSVNEIISLLVNAISPNAITKEDIVARKAVQEASAHIYEYIVRNDMDISCLDNMSQELVDISMCAYFTSYIWGTMMKDISSRLEIFETNPDEAFKIEQELKGYIKGIVEVELEKDNSIFQKSPDEAVDGLLEKCFEVMEGII